MKNFKKIASAIAALSLAACMVAPVASFAATTENVTTATITIDDEVTAHEYKAYKLFNGTLSKTTEDDGAVSYTLTDVSWNESVIDTKKLADNTANADLKAITGFSDINLSDAAAVVKALSASTPAKDGEIAKQFAKAIQKCFVDTPTSTDIKNSGSSFTATVDAGYYLITQEKLDDSLPDSYTRYLLQAFGNEKVTPKVGLPEVMKKVEESELDNDTFATTVTFGRDADGANDSFDVGAKYSDTADYNIGDVVSFRLYASMPEDIKEYSVYKMVFHDTLEANKFVFDNATGVKSVQVWNGTEQKTIDKDQYTVEADTEGTFKVTLNDILKLNEDDGETGTSGDAITIDDKSVIVVEYEATLSDTGVDVGRPGNENEVYLEFSNNPNYEGAGENSPTDKTTKDKVVVFTYEIDSKKIDGATATAGSPTTLANAQFQLYREYTDSETPKRDYAVFDGTGKFTGWKTATGTTGSWTAPTELGEGNTITITTKEDGVVKITGIDEGTYYLEETAAPAGYNKLSKPLTVTITANTMDSGTDVNRQDWKDAKDDNSDALIELTATVTSDDFVDGITATPNVADGTVAFNVANNKGASLPSTGGIGTTLFYLGGGALVAVAGVMLITKKRMTKE